MRCPILSADSDGVRCCPHPWRTLSVDGQLRTPRPRFGANSSAPPGPLSPHADEACKRPALECASSKTNSCVAGKLDYHAARVGLLQMRIRDWRVDEYKDAGGRRRFCCFCSGITIIIIDIIIYSHNTHSRHLDSINLTQHQPSPSELRNQPYHFA